MQFLNILIIFLSIFCQLTLLVYSVAKQPNIKLNFKCNRPFFERSLNRMFMLGDASFIFPNSLTEQNANCKKLKEVQLYSKEYAEQCLKGETRNIMKIILYNTARVNRGYCSNEARKNIFVSFGKCINRHRKSLVALNEAVNRDLHAVVAMPEKKNKIAILCCDYFFFKVKMMKLISDCSQGEQDAFETYLDGISTDGLSIMCSVQENSDQCEKLLKQIPKWTKPLRQKVIMITAIDVLDSL